MRHWQNSQAIDLDRLGLQDVVRLDPNQGVRSANRDSRHATLGHEHALHGLGHSARLGKQFAEGLEILFDLDQGIFVFELGKRKFQLHLFFFFTFFQFFSRSLNSEAFGIQ